MLATYPLILIGSAKLPANDFAEMLAYARANPGKINYGHQGKGNTGHLLGELLMLKGNFKMTEVPYRGSAPAINDLLASNIELVPDYLARQQGEHRCRQAQVPGDGRTPTPEGLSEGRDHRGDAAGRVRGYLDGGGRAARHAEGDREESVGCDSSGAANARDAGPHPRARGRAARLVA